MGTSPSRARAELELPPGLARRMERVFAKRTAPPGEGAQLPKFAKHGKHVAAVIAQGGFCAFSERRLAGDGMAVCLPLIWPEAARG